jgi:hypothetical protein
MRSIVFAGLFLAVAHAQTVRGDGLIYQLPADGAQVRYDTELALSAGEQDVKVKGSVTVSSVGQTTENGEKCRWIEFKTINPEDGQDRSVISKVLIPEKHLGKGQSAADNVIRVWIKEGDGEPQEYKDLKAPQAIALRTAFSFVDRLSSVFTRVPDSKSMPKFRPLPPMASAPMSRITPDIEKNHFEAPM